MKYVSRYLIAKQWTANDIGGRYATCFEAKWVGFFVDTKDKRRQEDRILLDQLPSFEYIPFKAVKII